MNLRGTLEVIQLARRAHDHHGLRRFSHVSTVAVAGTRQDEVVQEDTAIDWARSDYDPYARTKKFCEHMVHQLLPDVSRTIFVRRWCWATAVALKPRSSTWSGVQRAREFAGPALGRRIVSIFVPADYVGKAIVSIHQRCTGLSVLSPFLRHWLRNAAN